MACPVSVLEKLASPPHPPRGVRAVPEETHLGFESFTAWFCPIYITRFG